MLRKAVVPAAGLGTRLLTATKEMPKEMLPIFSRGAGGSLVLKPMLQAIFEQLYDAGFREFCFIVGRGKRAIEDHFNKDSGFLTFLRARGKGHLASELEDFYAKIDDSVIIFINQPEPRGFGDAVLRARPFTSDEPFLVHAGDDLVLSEENSHIKRLVSAFSTRRADAVFFIEEVENPSAYGVVSVEPLGEGLYKVLDIVEKPERPPSNLATIAIYVFSPAIYDAIRRTKPDKTGEIQLTDAIRLLVREGRPIYALELLEGERRVDIGTPEGYWRALSETLSFSTR